MRLSDKIQTYSMYEILGLIFERVILMWMYGVLSCIDAGTYILCYICL